MRVPAIVATLSFVVVAMSLPVVQEITSVKGFFEERGVGNGANDVALQKSFADTVIAMLNSMPMLSASEASQVMAALKVDNKTHPRSH